MLEERTHTCIVFLLFSRCRLLATVRDGFLGQLSPGLIWHACSYDSLKTDALQMNTFKCILFLLFSIILRLNSFQTSIN